MSTAVMQPSNELQYGLHHIARHNVGTPLEENWTSADDYSQNLSAQSNHGSPGLMQQSVDPFMNEPYGDDQYQQTSNQGTVGLGIQYSGYQSPPHYLSPVPNALVGSPYIDSVNTPMTPQSDTGFGGPRTRSGRSAARSDSPSVLGTQTNTRVTKSRPKKSKSNKAVNNKTPKLDAPLSELTKNMDIEVRDMVKWVNRSDEERHAETEKRNGYVTRPMNSFMLYRSAYAERTKQWCLQNNHQVVSSVSGESWPLEPDSVRDHYNELAKTERENHARAHPEYKFSPSKTPAAAAKKKRSDFASDDEEEDNETESGDPDWEWRPRNDRSYRSARPKRQGREAGYPAHSNLNSMFDQQTYGFNQNMHVPMWHEQPRQLPYNLDHFEHHYDQGYNHPDMGYTHQQYLPNGYHGVIPNAMPYMGHDEMFQPEPQMMHPQSQQLDPSLLSMGGTFGEGVKVEQDQKFEDGPMENQWGGNNDIFGNDMDHWASSA